MSERVKKADALKLLGTIIGIYNGSVK